MESYSQENSDFNKKGIIFAKRGENKTKVTFDEIPSFITAASF
jgi:hypothetical protein